ncbi:cytochrome c-type biogenesis CcmF C-terminal domain-containing protein [Sandaracinus amylolyticus]|uniref:Cytochrome c-type biogenesis protein n=1 Tax=Sandaracinus amylolyticus TaxID=927083 RepID=A0A0F6YLR6_9BACT|nr:cytochrome c-type biogenesis CcmF C-terminal domain-containing protein [Sandaracinus amylolyticus]AKF10657.1 Cytochrome c heme lyase subunit CcmF [Sandaracinus amylolyticus]
MPPVDVPLLGNVLVCAILIASSYTFAISLAAARGRPQLVQASRFGMFATIAFVAAAVFLLAYAFQAHDFRIRYVARYSDRSMSAGYLWTALWGGQDGSLLWWSFLLGGYSLAFTAWVKRRYLELQPWVYATLASIFAFFAILMLFAANPFATTYGPAPADGEGLNPLLQNYWMAIHPPALYMGLTGWAVPFGIVVAALMTGRVGDEWILMARRWVLLAFAFLSLGNLLGMFWSYEELGWGGYWAWDPVENASFMPWLLGTAYLHSVMIQERRGMLKVWNVSLLMGTFFFTIFGTFLTRSGLIASVHSFARSEIGIYFVWYMAALGLFIVTLIGWRLPELRSRYLTRDDFLVGTAVGAVLAVLIGIFSQYWALAAFVVAIAPTVLAYCWAIEKARIALARPTLRGRVGGAIESLLSREFAFVLNNWILTGMLLFVLIATTFPLISEQLRDQTVTVGPAYYNRWMVPLGLMLLFLMGVGPLIAWRKATGKNLVQAFMWPTAFSLLVMLVHIVAGSALGFPPLVDSSSIYETATGDALAQIGAVSPLVATTLATWVLVAIVQEFARGTAMRMRNAKESAPVALVQLVARARRRYGGYLVHLGIVLAYVGFTGAAYDVEREAALRPGGTMEVRGYTFRYDGWREEVDLNKRMVFGDVTALDSSGRELATLAPGKFVYRSHPEMPTSEVAIRTTPLEDMYVILSTIDPETSRATLRVIVRPFVWWIWFGGAILLLGVFVAAFPSVKEILGESEERSRAPRAAAATAAMLLAATLGGAALLVPGHAHAQADSSSTLHAHGGTVEIHDPTERQLFERVLCECGGCQRLPLSTCGCSWAENMRSELRQQLAAGATIVQIQADYRERFGARAIAVPSDSGLDRALWAVPVAIILAALGGLFVIGRRWRGRGGVAATEAPAGATGAEYDAKLEDELRRFEEP